MGLKIQTPKIRTSKRRAGHHRGRRSPAALILAVCATLFFCLPTADAGVGDLTVGGNTYSGDSFVFVLDYSSSLASPDEEPLMLLRSVVHEALLNLHPTQKFSLVLYGSGTVAYSTLLQNANAGNIDAAMAWLTAFSPSGANCAAQALIFGINILNFASTTGGTLIYIADEAPNCPGPAETLSSVTAANWAGVEIHTFVLPTGSANPATVDYLENIAAANGGTFFDLSLAPPTPEVIRGDANGDGSVNLADALHILFTGFGLTTNPICRLAADVNDDGDFGPIVDASTLLGYLFAGSLPTLAAPFPDCGVEPTPEGMTCEISDCP